MRDGICYNAASYARASKEDADSSTIENQQALMRDFAQSAPDIHIVREWADNGYSGVHFMRPGFEHMMEAVASGEINCIIIKDLSRLGRNYIEVGELLDVVFPNCGVRLIAVNDGYDSLRPQGDADDILVPFKNLINEQYLRDFSIKIRSNLSVKRKNGDFVGPVAPYGYKRDAKNPHKLAIDAHAADVVREIFRLKLEGWSQRRIAQWLNSVCEPSPAEYKRGNGRYYTPFQKNARAMWTAVAVSRVLQNPVYVGTLVQGKRTTPNYRIKKTCVKPACEWVRTENAHPPIVDAQTYALINDLLGRDMRGAPDSGVVFPLSGLLFCGECGGGMVRKKVGKYVYSVCAGRKAERVCPMRMIAHDVLESAVFEALRAQVALAARIGRFFEEPKRHDAALLEARISDRKRALEACRAYRQSLGQAHQNGVISQTDFALLEQAYAERIEDLREALRVLARELAWAGPSHAAQPARALIVRLIHHVDVYAGGRVCVCFRYRAWIPALLESGGC